MTQQGGIDLSGVVNRPSPGAVLCMVHEITERRENFGAEVSALRVVDISRAGCSSRDRRRRRSVRRSPSSYAVCASTEHCPCADRSWRSTPTR
ncbi:hypothetical protein ACWGR4_43690 [Embleya sp. NPDC055664]